MAFTPGPMEIVVVVVVALLIFGPKKLPEMGKAIGSAITEFKKGISAPADNKPEETAAAAEAKKIEPPRAADSSSSPSEPAG